MYLSEEEITFYKFNFSGDWIKAVSQLTCIVQPLLQIQCGKSQCSQVSLI